MKKIIALILSLVLILSFAACSKTTDENDKVTDSASDESLIDTDISSDSEAQSSAEDEAAETVKPQTDKDEGEKSPSKNEGTTSVKPQQSVQQKPETKPESKPESKPEVKPETKPEANTPKTIGNTLLADFKAKAGSSGDVLSLAKSLLGNKIIPFMGDAVNVEPGFLTGFSNNEITGFKDGAVFLPMIGTIPFVGYVFELENGADTSAFISTLKSKANMRWNVCTEADEMVAGSVGNKVFFVMCPNNFEE